MLLTAPEPSALHSCGKGRQYRGKVGGQILLEKQSECSKWQTAQELLSPTGTAPQAACSSTSSPTHSQPWSLVQPAELPENWSSRMEASSVCRPEVLLAQKFPTRGDFFPAKCAPRNPKVPGQKGPQGSPAPTFLGDTGVEMSWPSTPAG